MTKKTDAQRRLSLAKLLFKWKPHPSQRLWMLDESRVKVAVCGRRWGKTEAAAVDASAFAMLNPGSVQMIVAPTYDQSRLIFDTVENLFMQNAATRCPTKVTRTPYPRLRIGSSTIMARTADEDGRNLRGHSADRVIVDEAAFVRDAVVEEVISPMLADRDGQLVLISTPFGKNHFYRAFIQGQHLEGSEAKNDDREPENNQTSGHRRFGSFRFPSWANPFISRDYIEHQRKALAPRQFAVEYEAEFLDDQASVFSWNSIQNAVRAYQTAEASEEPWIVAGVDWARYSDYTAVVVVDVGCTPHRVVAIDRFHRLSWEAQIERVGAFLIGHRVNSVLTDQTSIGDPLLEQLRKRVWERGADISINGLMFSNSSKREIIDNLVIRLSGGEVSIPNDEALINELQYFEYELTNAGNVRMNARSGYHDDLVVSLALAEWQGRGRSGPARFLSGGCRTSANMAGIGIS